MKIVFFGSKSYDRSSFERENENYGYDIKFFTGNLSLDNVSLTRGADAVCIFVNDNASREVIQELAQNGVRLIALRCAGFNNVDLAAAAEYGITVVRVPAYSPYAVAEYSLALMLSLNRKIYRAALRTRDANFSLHGLEGFDMYGKTAGIIGTGKIAKILIHILRGLGMRVLGYDIYPDYEFAQKEGMEYVSLDELYRQSDIISLHCPLNEKTQYIIDAAAIEKMKDGVMIINTGRGKLINTASLIDALKCKKVGAAGLDVYEEEAGYFYEDHSDDPLDDDTLARLLSFNNVIVSSHQAFFTREAMKNISETTMENVKNFFEGKPQNIV
ncbi:MAG: 2-hydroxyacid dehydrogenase [Flavobacteriales bacterium]|nr:2-hydroxyacid dehydrogenase [Flavobacteriales bacterium]